MGDQRQHARGKLGDLVPHPRTHEDKRRSAREHLRQMTHRSVLDLRGSLECADKKPYDRRAKHHGEAHEECQKESPLGMGNERFGRHQSVLASPASPVIFLSPLLIQLVQILW